MVTSGSDVLRLNVALPCVRYVVRCVSVGSPRTVSVLSRAA